jgi:hypothetical protein
VESDDDNLPPAYLARVPFPAGGAVSAVLVPRSMEFLAVRLILDGHPLIGRSVTFHECSDDEEKGDPLGDPVVSDKEGVARLARVVPAGHYMIEIEGQPVTVVTTVSRLAASHDLHLPIGSEAVAHAVLVPEVDSDEDSEADQESA